MAPVRPRRVTGGGERKACCAHEGARGASPGADLPGEEQVRDQDDRDDLDRRGQPDEDTSPSGPDEGHVGDHRRDEQDVDLAEEDGLAGRIEHADRREQEERPPCDRPTPEARTGHPQAGRQHHEEGAQARPGEEHLDQSHGEMGQWGEPQGGERWVGEPEARRLIRDAIEVRSEHVGSPQEVRAEVDLPVQSGKGSCGDEGDSNRAQWPGPAARARDGIEPLATWPSLPTQPGLLYEPDLPELVRRRNCRRRP